MHDREQMGDNGEIVVHAGDKPQLTNKERGKPNSPDVICTWFLLWAIARNVNPF
jgi:hypothetical protein